jgi:hypothetical protein
VRAIGRSRACVPVCARLHTQLFSLSLSLSHAYAVAGWVAFVAWSILTALATLIWFFPLFNMSLSGEESAVVATLVPVVLGMGAVRAAVLHSQARA